MPPVSSIWIPGRRWALAPDHPAGRNPAGGHARERRSRAGRHGPGHQGAGRCGCQERPSSCSGITLSDEGGQGERTRTRRYARLVTPRWSTARSLRSGIYVSRGADVCRRRDGLRGSGGWMPSGHTAAGSDHCYSVVRRWKFRDASGAAMVRISTGQASDASMRCCIGQAPIDADGFGLSRSWRANTPTGLRDLRCRGTGRGTATA